MTGIAAEFATPKVMMPQVTKWGFCPEVLKGNIINYQILNISVLFRAANIQTSSN